MPNRVVKDRILNSRRLASVGWLDEVIYRRLLSVVDDFGRYSADEDLLRPHLFPRQFDKVRPADMSRGLDALHEAGLIRRYDVEGDPFLVVTNWQEKPRASKSKWPHIPGHAETCVWVRAESCTCTHVQADASTRTPPPNSDTYPCSSSTSEGGGPGEDIRHNVTDVLSGTQTMPPCTLAEALTWAGMSPGIPEEVVRAWWDAREAVNWLKSPGVYFAKWQSDLSSFNRNYQANHHERKTRQHGPGHSPGKTRQRNANDHRTGSPFVGESA